jgi:hypothetical protein
LLLALAEWLNVWRPPHRLGPWLLLGWGAGVSSTIYFTHIAVVVFWWVYGLRRVPWRYLLVATAVAFGIGALWELSGHHLSGLKFGAENSGLVSEAVGRWIRQARGSWALLIAFMRSSDAAGTALGAFPAAWWAFVAVGLVVSRRDDREWALAGIMSGLVPMVAMLGLLSLPRVAYFMYPAVYFLAAQGTVWLARATGRRLAQLRVPRSVARVSGIAVTVAAMALLASIGNADLLGDQHWNAQFHYALGIGR